MQDYPHLSPAKFYKYRKYGVLFVTTLVPGKRLNSGVSNRCFLYNY